MTTPATMRSHKNVFPVGVIAMLALLWLGLLGVTMFGWWLIHNPAPVNTRRSVTAGSSEAPATDTSSSSASTPARPRLVYSQDGLWRFVLKAGGAVLVTVLFLLLSVGVGVLVQEKAESVNE